MRAIHRSHPAAAGVRKDPVVGDGATDTELGLRRSWRPSRRARENRRAQQPEELFRLLGLREQRSQLFSELWIVTTRFPNERTAGFRLQRAGTFVQALRLLAHAVPSSIC